MQKPLRHKQQEALELLEQGIKDLSERGNWEQYLKVQSRFHRYSFGNVVMILSSVPGRDSCSWVSRMAGHGPTSS